ncbi:hypothetical protein ACP4OV_001446 [Aristida adscensionis]
MYPLLPSFFMLFYMAAFVMPAANVPPQERSIGVAMLRAVGTSSLTFQRQSLSTVPHGHYPLVAQIAAPVQQAGQPNAPAHVEHEHLDELEAMDPYDFLVEMGFDVRWLLHDWFQE